MADQNREAILRTFAARSHGYESESAWMTDSTLISPLVPSPFGRAMMLDVCTGTGVIARWGKDAGWSVIATDISPDMLRQAAQFVQTVQCDASHLPFPPAQFDLVVCRQGLQYLDVSAAFAEFRRVAGVEVRVGQITMIHPDDISFWRSYFDLVSPGRLHIFKPGEIATSMADIGLSVIAQKVIVRRDNLAGSIAHLPGEKAVIVRDLFASAPSFIRKRYHIELSSDDDYIYDHRWEFIIGSV